MDALEAILTRRSIRTYKDEPVPDDLVEELLRAAMAAPSANNEQAWQFVVLTDRAVLDSVPAIHPNCQMIAEAPLAILVCGDLSGDASRGYWIQDCAAGIENLLIAANAKGLGAVWTGIYPREERVAAVRRLLDLPEHIVPVAMIPIGWPDEQIPPAERYDPARVHRNRW